MQILMILDLIGHLPVKGLKIQKFFCESLYKGVHLINLHFKC